MSTFATPQMRWTTFSHALLFVIGFSIVFVIGWGGAATALGTLFYDSKQWLARIGGVVVILFGLHTLGILRIPFLDRDTRPELRGAGRVASSMLMGVVFAAGWSPCIGAVLGSILTLGMSEQGIAQAMVLSSGYALGLAIPFLIISLLMDRATSAVRALKGYMRPFQIGSGLLMIVMGVMLLTNQLFYISIWAQRMGLYVDLPTGGVTPTYLIAVLGGLVSFLSPCVLPLVPAYVGYLGGKLPTSGMGSASRP
jgi:cytochrome c-type biogenesis protein